MEVFVLVKCCTMISGLLLLTDIGACPWITVCISNTWLITRVQRVAYSLNLERNPVFITLNNIVHSSLVDCLILSGFYFINSVLDMRMQSSMQMYYSSGRPLVAADYLW